MGRHTGGNSVYDEIEIIKHLFYSKEGTVVKRRARMWPLDFLERQDSFCPMCITKCWLLHPNQDTNPHHTTLQLDQV